MIAMVEMSPKKSCDQGWTYDHSTVFTTITSEVGVLSIILRKLNNMILAEQLGVRGRLQADVDTNRILDRKHHRLLRLGFHQ